MGPSLSWAHVHRTGFDKTGAGTRAEEFRCRGGRPQLCDKAFKLVGLTLFGDEPHFAQVRTLLVVLS